MNENVYFECRKRAAIHNERLNSRAGAAEILGISESTLAHYELGITKNIPVDVAKLIYDALNGVAWYDDNAIVDTQVRKFYSDTPRVDVFIRAVE